MSNQPNIFWPGWEVVQVIGRGSFGTVYEIQRNTFGHVESAALKVISIPEKDSDLDDLYGDGYSEGDVTELVRGQLENIVREYSLMANLKGHPNVVYCEDFRFVPHEDNIGWDIYIKMELLTPLVKVLDKFVDEQQIVALGIDICSALTVCCEHSIVHRDIKPQNIFVTKDGTYKLGDFGIAKTVEYTTGGTKIGTYKYMAPEVYNNQPYGSSSDLYSLGLVLYWLLNERRGPFLPLPPQVPSTSMEEDARKRRFLGESIPAPAHGSEELKKIVLKACAYNPKERFTSAAEMREALLQMKNGNLTPADDSGADEEEVKDDTVTVEEVPVTEEQPIKEDPVIVADEKDADPVDQSDRQEEAVAEDSESKAADEEDSSGQADVSKDKAEPEKKMRKPVMWIALAAVLLLAVGIGIVIGGAGSRAKHEDHSYSGGICTECNYEWPYKVEKMTAETRPVIKTAGTWTRPYSNNSINKENLPVGTTVTVVASTKNQAGNLWYQTKDGLWIYSENLGCAKHSYSSGICEKCKYEWPYEEKKITEEKRTVIKTAGTWTRPYSKNSTNKGNIAIGETVTIVASTKNQSGNLWYKTKDGLWVYSENLGCSEHSYSGGICEKCKYEWPYKVKKMDATKYKVTSTAGTWTRPYSQNSTNKGNIAVGKTVTIVASAKNQSGNLWYQTKDGLWIYSKNLKKIS